MRCSRCGRSCGSSINALLLYNVAVVSGRFDAFRDWVLASLPNDRRVVLVVIGFCFGALLEGISGFGTPVAITSSLLILVGYPPLEALTFTLIFNTAPVAFGALGVPVTVLGVVTHLPDTALGAMIGRQLPIMALILPFYVMAMYGGRRSVAALWPMLLVAGGSFGLAQFAASNLIDYRLTDVLSSMVSLIATIGFLQVWQPAPDPVYAINAGVLHTPGKLSGWQGWLPWIVVSVIVILWTHFKVFLTADQKFSWPGLNNAVAITLYGDRPYAAVWDFQPLATGTAILLAAIVTAALVRRRAGALPRLRRHHAAPDQARDPHRGADRGAGLRDELLGHDLHSRPGRGVGRAGVPAGVRLPRLGRGVPVRLRHLRQRPVRQPAGRGRQSARAQPAADRGDQLVGRRDGQDDLAAEHRHRRVRHQPARPGGRGARPHLLAQHRAHPAARCDRGGRAVPSCPG